LGLLATVTLEVIPIHIYALFPALLPFLNASWKSCSVVVFITACDSVSITSVASIWQETKKLQGAKSGEFGWVRGDSHVDFGQKLPGEK
jgi:hypothetical protein